MKIGVMHGRLAELDLAQILQVVGLGRQYTGVEVRRGDEVTGTIFVKSGKVVSVVAPNGAGREAFFRLFHDTASEFFVFRMETPVDLPEPLGALNGLLMEAFNAGSAVGGSVPPSRKAASWPPNHQDWEIPTKSGVSPGARKPATLSGRDVALPQGVGGGWARGAPSATGTSAPLGNVAPVGNARVPGDVAPLGDGGTQKVESTPKAKSVARAAAQAKSSSSVGGRPRAIVAIASPKGGSGKTTTSLNLALALARQGRSVTLVDADVNGDVLSSINARHRARFGAFDLLAGRGTLDEALFKTVLPGFQILCAVGPELPEPALFSTDHSLGWQALLQDLSDRSEVVVVDTPSGMFGVTHQILSACTHVIGVLQAEVVANRSFERFTQGLHSLPASQRPKVLGVLLNMLQVQQGASVNVFQSACTELPKEWLFDTCIPRNPAFLLATDQGLPLRHLDENAPPAVAWLYDNLAGEAVERLALAPVERRPQPLLL